MNKINKNAFTAALALVCYAGFATAQVVSFDSPGSDIGTIVKEIKFGGQGGHGGGHVPAPSAPTHVGGGFGNNHGNNGWDHNGPGNHGGFYNNNHGNNGWDHNGPGNHNGPWNPQPDPWNPLPNPWQPAPWQPGPQPGQWHPHHNGHPDWNNNNWGNNHWNNHGPAYNPWWNSYNYWWVNNFHPYSMYRTVCDVTAGVSAKGFIVEQTMPFYGKATFYYYNAFNSLVGTSSPTNGVYSGGNGTPVFDFYQVPRQAEHCFLAITQ